MADAARRIEPVTLDEFRAMDFGGRTAELVGGRVTVAQAFPSSRHGRITAGLTVALTAAVDKAEADCADAQRVESGTGLEIRLETDFSLGPDLMIRCGGEPGEPVLVAEILSPSKTASEMPQQLRAYQSVESLTDILILDQDRAYAEHWTRRNGQPWGAPDRHMGIGDTLALPRFGAEIPLSSIYRTALRAG